MWSCEQQKYCSVFVKFAATTLFSGQPTGHLNTSVPVNLLVTRRPVTGHPSGQPNTLVPGQPTGHLTTGHRSTHRSTDDRSPVCPPVT
eukprot:gene23864-biopygen5867